MASRTVDDVIQEAGCGRFQVLVTALGMASTPLSVWSMLFMVFGSLEPDWGCVSPSVYNASRQGSGVGLVNVSLAPWNERFGDTGPGWDNASYKQCYVKGSDVSVGDETELCQNIVFDRSMNTVVSEFQLVCDLAWVPPMTISAQMVGVLLGASLAGQLSDNLGRKKTLIGITAAHALLNLITAFSVNWQMFTVLRALVGLTIGGTLATSFTYPTEFLGVGWRAVVGGVPVWGVGAVSFSLLVWWLQNWKYVHIATAIVTAACLPAWIFLPESARWLAVRGRLPEAHAVLRQMARLNGRKSPSLSSPLQSMDDATKAEQSSPLHLQQDEKHPNGERLPQDETRRNGERHPQDEKHESGTKQKQYHMLHLFSSRAVTKVSLLNGFMWFSCSLTYYGISFGVKNLSGDFFLNFFLMTCVEIPPVLLLFPLARCLGRRWIVAGSLWLCAVSIWAVVPVLLIMSDVQSGLWVNVLCMAARAAMNLGWGAMTVYLAELYPTVIRNIGIGYCNTTARFGGILAPYILSMGEPYLFYVIIGVVMLLTSVAPLFMRETGGQPLQDHLEAPPEKDRNDKKDKKELELML